MSQTTVTMDKDIKKSIGEYKTDDESWNDFFTRLSSSGILEYLDDPSSIESQMTTKKSADLESEIEEMREMQEEILNTQMDTIEEIQNQSQDIVGSISDLRIDLPTKIAEELRSP